MFIDVIFNEFVNVIRENKKYIIGMVSNEGVITACSVEEKVGETLDVHKQDANNIFYSICVKNQNFGFLWVNGNDENLVMMSNLIRESLIIRFTYEMTQRILTQDATNDDRLTKLLLDDQEFDMNQILDLADEMGIDQHQTRIAIYLLNDKGFDNRNVLKLKLLPDGKRTIFSMLSSTEILIYKDVPDDMETEKRKEYIRKFLMTLKNLVASGTVYYVGSMQKKLKNYKVSYQHCMWLKEHISIKQEKILFFTDHLYDFYLSKIQLSDVSDVFDYYKECSRGIDIDELIRISDFLFKNSFNISQTADDLYLHKNTLVYKLKKYEDSFQIDIRGDFKGRLMFVLIASWMKEYQKRKQVGEEL